jgi:hypothetical protein
MHKRLQDTLESVVPKGVSILVLEEGCTFQRVTLADEEKE